MIQVQQMVCKFVFCDLFLMTAQYSCTLSLSFPHRHNVPNDTCPPTHQTCHSRVGGNRVFKTCMVLFFSVLPRLRIACPAMKMGLIVQLRYSALHPQFPSIGGVPQRGGGVRERVNSSTSPLSSLRPVLSAIKSSQQ